MSKIAPDHLSRQAFVYVRHPRETDSGTTTRAGVGVGSTGSPTALAGWVGLYEEWACDRWGSRTRPWLSTGTSTAQHRRLFALGAELLVRRLRRADGRCS